MMNDGQLIDKANAICGCLSYDDITPNGSPKAVIAELCHRSDLTFGLEVDPIAIGKSSHEPPRLSPARRPT